MRMVSSSANKNDDDSSKLGTTPPCSAQLVVNPKDVVVSPWIFSYDANSISRSIVVKDWIAAIQCINAIGNGITENDNQLNHHHHHHHHHHPDIHLTKDRELSIVLTTHSVGGITQRDIDLAQTIDIILVEYVSPQWLREQQEDLFHSSKNDDDDDDAVPPVLFDQTHFVNGLNGDFLQPNAKEKFYKSIDTTTTTTTFTESPGIFENPEIRDIAAAKHEIVKLLHLSEGMIIADVGAGTGLLVPLLSEAVGETGQVLVSELSPIFRDIVQERCRHLSNVHIIDQPTDRNPQLPTNGTVDVILLVDVYHHLEYPQSVLRHIRLALHPHGALMVIDFHRDPTLIQSHDATWVYQHLRADQATFTQEIERCGFVLVQEVKVPALPENYVLVFRKRPIPLSEPGAGWTY